MKPILTYKVNSISPLSIECTDGTNIHSDDIVEILNYLTRNDQDVFYTTWDIDTLAALVLRYIDIETLQKLADNDKASVAYKTPDGNKRYTIFYIPEKMFAVKRMPKEEITIYTLNRYFPHIEEEPEGYQIYANRLKEAIEIMGLEPKRLSSPVAVYASCELKRHDIPNRHFDHWNMVLNCLECSRKQWVEAYKVGYFPEAYDLDIKGAYPTVLMHMPDTRQFKWMRHPDYQPKAMLGYCRGIVTIYENVYLHPIFDTAQEPYRTPVGTWHTYLTKAEIDFIKKWGIGEFVINDAWWGFPTEEITYPVRDVMTTLLEWKKHENIDVRNFAKAASVGIYGKFGEEIPSENRFGNFFNPVYFAEATSRGRIELADCIYRNKLHPHVIHISTDGGLIDKPVTNLKQNSIFEWDIEGPIPALCIGTGHLYIKKKHPQGVYLDDVLQAIDKNPDAPFYRWTKERVIKLKQGLQLNKVDLIGQSKPHTTTLDLSPRGDFTRYFPNYPRTGQELISKVYDSEPLIYGG